MAKLLVVVNANTEVKKVGDIQGVYDDDKDLSGGNLAKDYEIFFISGLTIKEVRAALPYPATKSIFRLPVAALWTDVAPEEKTVWFDPMDGLWKFLEYRIKYRLNVTNLNILDRESLASILTTVEGKIVILEKSVNRYQDYPENLVECKELNG